MMEVFDFFNTVYKENKRYWWLEDSRYSLNPNDYTGAMYFFIQQVLLKEPGFALDLGAGEGADSIRLALMGYEVDAVEGSSVGAEKIKKFAKEMKTKVNVINENILNFTPNKKYDIIMCNGLLHYIYDKKKILKTIQECTNRNGINMISLFSDFSPVPKCHKIVNIFSDKENGITINSYKNWTILLQQFERSKIEKHHPGFPRHCHSFIKIIAKKADIIY